MSVSIAVLDEQPTSSRIHRVKCVLYDFVMLYRVPEYPCSRISCEWPANPTMNMVSATWSERMLLFLPSILISG